MAWRKDYNVEAVEEDKQSRINAAGLINATLEKLWLDCYNAMALGKYSLWNIKLDAIWAILGGDEKEGDIADKEITKLDLQIYNCGSLKSKTGTGFDEKENPNNAIQYHLLKKKSIFLRRLQNKQGKGTAYENPDMEDFD
ncbi:MAG TPA: hypothetical protein VJ438_06060 [Candidatus Nanoarchaeia archaeon]|nr:hypothetical protein [Candidatus Nanoarchaeia archaeon]